MPRLLLRPIFIFLLTLPLCSPVASAGESAPIRVLFLGDSLTDGYGIAREDTYPALLERRFRREGYPGLEAVNAGVSGSTSASGLARLRWQLTNKPAILVLALGANDGLRGTPIAETRRNLSAVLRLAQAESIHTLLAGMKLPPNYGPQYVRDFEALYQQLSRSFHVPVIPFLLEGVAAERQLNQEDGIHPNEKGHQRIAETLYPHLLKILATYKAKDRGP